MSQTLYILVLYYSRNGATKKLAQAIARGIEQVDGMEAMLRTVPAISAETEQTSPTIPEDGDLYCTQDELSQCSGLVLGSPTRFGNMAAPLKYFLDSTAGQWANGALIDKPAGVFTSTGSMHGGQESTLLSMMLPLIHHGMVIAGVPYNVDALHTTQTGGTPYGPSHCGHSDSGQPQLSQDEKAICMAYGKRIAQLARTLNTDDN